MRVVVTMTHSINAAGSYRVGAYSLRSRKAIFVDTDSKKGVMSDAEYRRITDMKKTTWIVKGPFGTRRIWKDDRGMFFVVNNIRYPNHDEKLEFINEVVQTPEVKTQ